MIKMPLKLMFEIAIDMQHTQNSGTYVAMQNLPSIVIFNFHLI